MCKKKEVRRLRKAQRKCGCESLKSLILLAAQTKDVPRKLDIDAVVDGLRRLETEGYKAVPEFEVPKFALAFADEVLMQRNAANCLKGLWTAKHSSGRITE